MRSSGGAEDHARRIGNTAVPTAGRLAVHSIPAVVVAVAGPPLLAVTLPEETGDGWWFLAFLSLFGLAGLLQYFVQSPQPRLDKRISQERWKWALSSVINTRSVPVDPAVRTNAAVVACAEIQALMVFGAFILGAVLGMFVRPEFPWLTFLGAPIGLTLVSAFRLRRSLTYLNLLRAQARPDWQRSQPQ